MTHQVVYSSRAHKQLRAIYDWIAGEAGPEIAQRFVLSIYDYCDDLAGFPLFSEDKPSLHDTGLSADEGLWIRTGWVGRA